MNSVIIVCIIFLAVRALRRAVRVEQVLKEQVIICMYCAYVLETDTWPQRCPECGKNQTLDEVIAYWEPHANLDWFKERTGQ